MSRFQWTGPGALRRHSHDERIEPGEVFTPTDAEQRAFGDSLEPVDQEDESDDESEVPPVETSPIDPADHTVADLETALEDDDYDWTDAALRGLRKAEEAGKNRDTAIDAIETRLEG